ncbi:hypothetical protein [Massilia sp. YIM B04103]|uniref:hypothetical protein n=1 Tax=Massilia sp. YIM B04103 TaxID=2963106 RepID=UPI00210BB8F1|nr:hypothetical protein [Massilia sp. YIM B04103]
MKFAELQRHAAALASGNIGASAAAIHRALNKKEMLRCARAWSRFTTACLQTELGERGKRHLAASWHLPPVA